MSLLGIDVGTTGCKAAVFSEDGSVLSSSYAEYDADRPAPGQAQLDARALWEKIRTVIRQAVSSSGKDPVKALSVSSLGEAVVPVSGDHEILGPSLLNFDQRGAEFLDELSRLVEPPRLYAINGNTLGNHYALTKLLWTRKNTPDVYSQAHKFLHWSGFVSFLLGAEPAVDYSLANRTLLFDVEKRDWSQELCRLTDVDPEKLPKTVPSGTVIGTVSRSIASELSLSDRTAIVSGCHDQCANAVGCGAIFPGMAAFGMGTYLCITPVFVNRPASCAMIERGLNTEHHAVPGRYVSFIYNQGGSLVKWFRDTFAAEERRQADAQGTDIYEQLFSEMSPEPGTVLVLPHFTATGPPHFLSGSCGVIAGLRLETGRADILKGIAEGTVFYLKECVDNLGPTGIEIADFRATGGGSRSDRWVQMSADILDRPFFRPAVQEAGCLGAALIAGVGSRAFGSFEDGVGAMVRPDREFLPDPQRSRVYAERFHLYRRLHPLLGDCLRALRAGTTGGRG